MIRGAVTVLAAAVAGLLPAASAGPAGSVAGPAVGEAAAGGHGLRINQLQAIGTHNSYQVEASAAEKALRTQVVPDLEPDLEYGHPPLPEQFSGEHVRQIELDVFADPAGGLYAQPLIRTLAGEGPYDPVMREPGFKVLHAQDVDYRSTCLTLAACLTAVREWSDAHRSHVPIAVLLELKDETVDVPGVPYPLTVPVPWTAALLDALDAQLRAAFPPSRLITPDDVRRGAPTLEAAVLRHGWPTVEQSRGKVMFLMDNAGARRTAYLAGHPALRGRVLFTNSTPGQPDAAFIEENDPTGAGQARIADEVRRGYLVRTRADADTVQARTGDTSRLQAALASGAQWVSTDYPVPGLAARFGTDYVAQLPGGVPVRCNPVTAPPHCTAPSCP